MTVSIGIFLATIYIKYRTKSAAKMLNLFVWLYMSLYRENMLFYRTYIFLDLLSLLLHAACPILHISPLIFHVYSSYFMVHISYFTVHALLPDSLTTIRNRVWCHSWIRRPSFAKASKGQALNVMDPVFQREDTPFCLIHFFLSLRAGSRSEQINY